LKKAAFEEGGGEAEVKSMTCRAGVPGRSGLGRKTFAGNPC